MIFVFIISVVMGAIDNSKYDVIKFGDAHFILPKRIAECVDKNEGEDYVFLQSDKYFILGIGPECDEVDNVILEQFDVSYEKLKGINSIEHEYELEKLLIVVKQINRVLISILLGID